MMMMMYWKSYRWRLSLFDCFEYVTVFQLFVKYNRETARC